MNVGKVHQPNQHSALRRTAAVVLTAGVTTGAVLYMAKTGKLNAVEGGNKYVEAFKAALKKPADAVLAKGGEILTAVKNSENPAVKKIADVARTAKTKASGIVENAGKLKEEAAKKMEALDLGSKVKTAKSEVGKAFSTVLDTIESKFNKEKFAEAAKTVAEEAAEAVI